MNRSAKMTEKSLRKPDILRIFARLGVFVAALLTAFAFCLPAHADDCSISVEWPGGVFDIGDEIVIEFSIYGLEKGRAVSGSINAEYKGLGFSIPEAAPGFNVKANLQPGSVTITFETDGKFTPSSDGKAAIVMLKAYITEEPETSIKAYAVVSDGSMNTMTQQGIYTVKRKDVPTPTPVPGGNPTPSPTIVPTDAPTPTPTPTLVPANTEDPGGNVTPVPTEAPTPCGPDPTEGSMPEPTAYNGSGRAADDTVKLGKIVFWAFVALVGGVWIGIAVGAVIWRKKSIFVTDEEKKIIGKK